MTNTDNIDVTSNEFGIEIAEEPNYISSHPPEKKKKAKRRKGTVILETTQEKK